jgi:hypothetical protein
VICSGGCVSRRVAMGSRANKYLIAITVWSSRFARRIKRDPKRHRRCFSPHYRGRRRPFSTPNAPARESFRSSGDAQVPLATTEPTTARNYPKFPQRTNSSIELAPSVVERDVAGIDASRASIETRQVNLRNFASEICRTSSSIFATRSV